MASTWDEVNTKLSLFLDDEGGTNYSVPLRVWAWNAAQRVLAVHHTPREKTTSLTMESGERSAVLPPDFIAVWKIYDSDQQRWYSEYRPGATYKRSTDSELGQYWVWGNKLYFEKSIDVSNTDHTMYYAAYWPDITYQVVDSEYAYTDDEVIIPDWAELPVTHLTAATCLQPGALEAAKDRNYNLSVIDSGTPIQNARAVQAREHVWWWTMLLGMVRPRDFVT